jgi:hypothetical protein
VSASPRCSFHAAQIACGLVTAVGFLVWLHRARVNVRALGVRRLRFRREWTVLGFLIPGLNLVRPFQVVQEIWQASDPSVGDPIAWKKVRTPPLLVLWWAAFVGYLALEVGSGTLLSIVSGLSRIQLAYGIGMAADACAALSASLGYFVVVRISDAQEEKLPLASTATPPCTRRATGSSTPGSIPAGSSCAAPTAATWRP